MTPQIGSGDPGAYEWWSNKSAEQLNQVVGNVAESLFRGHNDLEDLIQDTLIKIMMTYSEEEFFSGQNSPQELSVAYRRIGALARKTVRDVFIDYRRSDEAQKRGGGFKCVSIYIDSNTYNDKDGDSGAPVIPIESCEQYNVENSDLCDTIFHTSYELDPIITAIMVLRYYQDFSAAASFEAVGLKLTCKNASRFSRHMNKLKKLVQYLNPDN